MSSICDYRNDCGRKYTEALAGYLSRDWLDSYHTFVSGGMMIWEKFALIHPLHAGEPTDASLLRAAWKAAQGPSSFARKPTAVVQCQAVVVWGYHCPVTGENMEQDHLFPHSLGGITCDRNRIWLCRYHNMLKGNDVHCYPWEDSARWASWLDDYIEKVHSQVFLNQGC